MYVHCLYSNDYKQIFGPSWLGAEFVGAEFVRGRDVQLPSKPLPTSGTYIHK